MIVVAESSRRAAFLLLEDAVEVADVVEAATVAYLGHAGVCINKQAGCITQTDVDDVVADCLACPGTEETAEGSGSHACDISQSLQSNLLLEVLVDVFFDCTNASAFRLILYICETLAG